MYDFDKIIDRKGTGTVKYGALKDYFGREDLLPLWVADMDFETPDFIVEALRRRLDHPVFGYSVLPEDYWPAVIDWVRDRHGWDIKAEWLRYIPGIVKGIGMVINTFLAPDEKVVIQPPVYHPFRLVPEGNRRQVVYNPLLELPGGGYEMDLNGLEAAVRDPKVRLLILSNPHNPAGIVWPSEVLRRVAEICAAHGVLVISDEIHCDMALFGHKHVPFASVSDTAASISITFQAPTKTFNIAGIVSSYAVVPDPRLRERFFGWLDANEMASPNLFAPIATVAAFRKGEPWRSEMVAYVEENVCFVEAYCREHLPVIRPLRPQASFLVWLDCRGLGLTHEGLVDLFVNGARVAFNDGAVFSPGGDPLYAGPGSGCGYMRLNVGCPRSELREALDRISAVVSAMLPGCQK